MNTTTSFATVAGVTAYDTLISAIHDALPGHEKASKILDLFKAVHTSGKSLATAFNNIPTLGELSKMGMNDTDGLHFCPNEKSTEIEIAEHAEQAKKRWATTCLFFIQPAQK